MDNKDPIRLTWTLAAISAAVEGGDKAFINRNFRQSIDLVDLEIEKATCPEYRHNLKGLREQIFVMRYYKSLTYSNNYRNESSHPLESIFHSESEMRFFSKKNLIFAIELLCPPVNRDGIIGDIVERYEDVKETQGERRADIWFRTQVMWTTLSLLGERFRSLPGIAFAAVALSWIGRKLAGG